MFERMLAPRAVAPDLMGGRTSCALSISARTADVPESLARHVTNSLRWMWRSSTGRQVIEVCEAKSEMLSETVTAGDIAARVADRDQRHARLEIDHLRRHVQRHALLVCRSDEVRVQTRIELTWLKEHALGFQIAQPNLLETRQSVVGRQEQTQSIAGHLQVAEDVVGRRIGAVAKGNRALP